MQVAIKDQDGKVTTGKVSMAEVGQTVTVDLHNENGMPIKATGEVIEILED